MKMKFLTTILVLVVVCFPALGQSAAGIGSDQSMTPSIAPTIVKPTTVSATITANRAAYHYGAPVFLTFSVTNHSKSTINYEFNSAQMYDVVITNSIGTPVWTWSKSRLFSSMITNLNLAPDKTSTFVIKWKQRDDGDDLVAAGIYTATATLIPMDRPVVSGNFLTTPNNDPTNTGIPMDNVQTGAVKIQNTTPQVYAKTTIVVLPSASSNRAFR